MNGEETAIVERPAALALTRHNPADLALRLADMKENRRLTQAFFKDVLEEGVDYGIIPGTDKPSLWKPGAEGLCELYGYAPTIRNIQESKDFETGFLRVVVTIALVQRGTGEIVAEGIGECNTREARYFYRWTPEWELKKFPDLWAVKDSFKREERSWKATAKRRAGSAIFYRLENDDLFTLWNTVLKQAKKRAFVDATLSATRSSGLFSQGQAALEDWIEAEYEDVTDKEEAPEQSEQQPARARTATRAEAVAAITARGAPHPAAASRAAPPVQRAPSFPHETSTAMNAHPAAVDLAQLLNEIHAKYKGGAAGAATAAITRMFGTMILASLNEDERIECAAMLRVRLAGCSTHEPCYTPGGHYICGRCGSELTEEPVANKAVPLLSERGDDA